MEIIHSQAGRFWAQIPATTFKQEKKSTREMAGTSSFSTSIQLLVCLAIIVKSVSSAPVSLIFSGDEPTNKNDVGLAKNIADEAGEMYSELCNTPNLCGSSMERNLKMELKLPEIADSCLSKKFNKDQCLHTIHRDLLRFQIYLNFLKKSMKGEKERVESIQHKTKDLAEAVQKMQKNPPKEKEDIANDISEEDLKSKDSWNEKLTTYLILQSFKDYMIKATRAIRKSTA